MSKLAFLSRTMICVALVLVAGPGCSNLSRTKAALELINHKDLASWSYLTMDPQVKMEEVWSLQDGVLNCKGDPVGCIYTGPEMMDFMLVVEYRWAPGSKPGNSGIFSRIQGDLKPLPKAVEVQLKHGSAGDVIGLQGRQIASGQPRFFEIKKHPLAGDIAGVNKLSDQEKPAGEWNRVEILARGPKYTVWVNGKLVNQVEGVETVPGLFGLQSEGGAIQFRRASLYEVK